MKKELLRMDHVRVQYNGEILLDDLNFQMFAGEIMGLVARDQKGCDQMIGLIRRNDPIAFGSVWYDGRVVNRYSYSDGSANRVYVIEQESHLVRALSVVDNLFVMREGFRKYFISERVLREQAERFFAENGIPVDISRRVDELTSLERCLVEVGKALMMNTRLIIVDNPMNFLSQHEIPEFQRMLRKICAEGVSVLYVGNHHQEVFRIADRTSLFFGGQIRKIFGPGEMTDERMAPYITEFLEKGRTEEETEQEDGVLHFHHVYAGHLAGLDFVLHRGECLTLLDMDNGISDDILGLLTGEQECEKGRITLDHEPYGASQAERYLDMGVAAVPKDSQRRLLFYDRTYMENLTFLLDRKIKKSLISPRIYRSIRDEYRPLAGDVIDEKHISRLELEDLLALVYYRIQILKPRLLICIQPLAKGDMHCRLRVLDLIRGIQKQGTAVLIVTANVSDTLEISDRMLVVENGAGTALYEKNEFDQILR